MGCRACGSAGRRLPVPRHGGDVPGRRRGARPGAAPLGAGAVGPADLARHGAPLGARAGRARSAAASTIRDILTDARDPQRHDRPRRVRRLDEPAAPPPGDRPRGRPPAARRSTTGPRSTAACRASSTCCPTARATTRPSASSWPAACPRSCSTSGASAFSSSTASPPPATRSGRMLDWWEGSERRRRAARASASAGRRRPRRRDHDARAGARARAHEHDHLPARQPRARGLGHQEHRHRSRPSSTPTASTARPGRRASSRPSARRSPPSRARGPSAIKAGDVLVLICRGPMGAGHGGDLPDHRGPQAPVVRQARRRPHRRPLLRRLHRRVHRPRRPGGAGRRARSASSARATGSGS